MKKSDLAGIIGLALGVLALIVGMFFKHVPFSALANPAAFFIIIVGTFGAVILATPKDEFKQFGTLLSVIFGKQRFMDTSEAIKKVLVYSNEVRKNGLLSLEKHMQEEKDPFLVRALGLMLDGILPEDIDEALNNDLYAMEHRHAGYAQIFTQMGTYAPTLGVLGAVLGLIAALTDLNNVDVLGQAISAAFVATLLGIFTGYVLWHPMANKLKRKSKLEVRMKTAVILGLVSISEGKHPRMIKDNLLQFLTEKEQEALNATLGEEINSTEQAS